jgi:FkbM family methyltransferase
MKTFLRTLAEIPLRITHWYLGLLARWFPGVRYRWRDDLYSEIQSEYDEVFHTSPHGVVTLRFSTPNSVSRYRSQTFSSKEPETLEWIEQFGGEGAFFDVGANVGLYSIYYAKLFPGKVYAFEPSALNLRLLVENINANEVSKQVAVITNPLSAQSGISQFLLSMTEEGGSMSTFGEDFGHDGSPLSVEMRYACLGLTLDSLCEANLIPDFPALVKIDVDGIEHLILRGARSMLTDMRLRSILIEVNSDFRNLAEETKKILSSSGFELQTASHADMFESGEFSNTYNQVWARQ